MLSRAGMVHAYFCGVANCILGVFITVKNQSEYIKARIVFWLISSILFWAAVYQIIQIAGSTECGDEQTTYSQVTHVMDDGRECVIYYDTENPGLSRIKCELEEQR